MVTEPTLPFLNPIVSWEADVDKLTEEVNVAIPWRKGDSPVASARDVQTSPADKSALVFIAIPGGAGPTSDVTIVPGGDKSVVIGSHGYRTLFNMVTTVEAAVVFDENSSVVVTRHGRLFGTTQEIVVSWNGEKVSVEEIKVPA